MEIKTIENNKKRFRGCALPPEHCQKLTLIKYIIANMSKKYRKCSVTKHIYKRRQM